MKELGEYLKETRENNCVELDEVSDDLKIPVDVLENIECGNTRAFRDMYELKEKVKDYAKYLGLKPEDVIDEFNDFFFEHTSKISLSDILEAEKKSEDNKKTVTSPYTKEVHPTIDKKYIKYFLIAISVIFIIYAIVVLILHFILPTDTTIRRELINKIEYKEVI